MKKNLTLIEVRQLPKDSSFSILGIISKITRRKDRNNNPFWEVMLSDGSGELEGKIWSASSWWSLQDGDKVPIDPDNCSIKFEGATVNIQGKVAEFRDQIQYNFNEVSYLDQDKFPPSLFARRSPIPEEKLEEMFLNLLTEVTGPLNNFLDSVFFKHGLWEEFKIWPAGVSLHHAYTGGLLEHSISVATGAKEIAKNYINFQIPVDINLVVAGGLLHDIGKLEMYAINPVAHVTVKGNLIDHIILGHHKFMKLAEAENLDSEISLAIAHIIVSHHGRREYGSPVLPSMPEALIISAADDLDFKLNYWRNQIDALNNQNEVTDLLPVIERRFWRGIKK